MKIWIDLKVLLMASVLLTTLQGVVAKRSGLGRRAKTSSGRSYSGRSNQQHHYAPQPAPKPAAPPKSSVVAPPKSASNVAASAPKPAAPATNQQPIGWNVGNGKHNPSAPVGPPPPYPGASHYHPGIGAAPPAYSPRNAHPPPYSSLNHNSYQQGHSPYQQQHAPQMSHAADSSRFYGLGPTNFGQSNPHNPYMSSGYGGFSGYGGSPHAMGGHGYYPGAGAGGFGGGMGMGGAPMMMGGGMYGYQKPKSSLFSLSNILTGVALYGTVRSLSGGGWGGGGYGSNYGYGGAREVHIYDHRDHGKDTAENIAIQQAIGVPVANVSYVANTPTATPLAPYPVTGSNVPIETPAETVEEMTLPPLATDNVPKIYYGYGFAYGYGEYSVDSESSSVSSSSSSEEEKTEGSSLQKASTSFSVSEENTVDFTTESPDSTINDESQEVS